MGIQLHRQLIRCRCYQGVIMHVPQAHYQALANHSLTNVKCFKIPLNYWRRKLQHCFQWSTTKFNSFIKKLWIIDWYIKFNIHVLYFFRICMNFTITSLAKYKLAQSWKKTSKYWMYKFSHFMWVVSSLHRYATSFMTHIERMPSYWKSHVAMQLLTDYGRCLIAPFYWYTYI